jgi:hypothetical protein
MTYQRNRNKGGRPKAVKGKARTKTISTRLTLAEWKTDYRCRQETVALPARTVAARQSRGGTDTGGQAADKDAGGRVQQPEPTGEAGAPAGLFSFERQNHGLVGRVQ